MVSEPSTRVSSTIGMVMATEFWPSAKVKLGKL